MVQLESDAYLTGELTHFLSGFSRVEEQFRILFEHSPVGIGFTSLDGRLMMSNKAMLEMCGMSAHEARQKTIFDIYHDVSDREVLIGQLMKEGRVKDYEIVLRRGDGTTFDALINLAWCREAEPPLIQSILIDISEKKRISKELEKAKEYAEQLIQTANVMVVGLGLDGNVEVFNQTAEQVSGYRRDELEGKNCIELMVPKEQQVAAKEVFAQIAKGHSVAKHETNILTKSGEVRRVLWQHSQVKDGTKISGSLSCGMDITELRKLQEQLMISDRLSSVGLLAASVAHEINNPLSVILSCLQLLQESGEEKKVLQSGEQQQWLADALSATKRVQSIVRDLKVFSRPKEESLDRLDVCQVVEACLRMAQNEIRLRARLTREFQNVPQVLGSEAQLGQILMNLLLNAAQSIPEGNIEGNEIRVRVGTAPDGRVSIQVQDSGSGMPTEVQRRLFTSFYTTKPSGLGTGLGLSICQRLVSAMHGEIQVESAPGKGSVFRVLLPPAVSPLKEAPPPAVLTAHPAKGCRVLVVDDEPMIVHLAQAILGRWHQVSVCSSGRCLLEMVLGGDRFDVILCDLMMPGFSGIDAFHAIEKVSADQAKRMVFLSGGAFTDQAQEFWDQSDNPKIEKPFDLHSLTEVVNRVFRDMGSCALPAIEPTQACTSRMH